jgi:hypothetical protein
MLPSLSFVGPKTLLNTFLSNTINLIFIVSFKTHVSQPNVTVGLLILQYSFNFDVLEINLNIATSGKLIKAEYALYVYVYKVSRKVNHFRGLVTAGKRA